MLRLVNEEGGKGEGRETSWEDTAVIQETDETYLGQDGSSGGSERWIYFDGTAQGIFSLSRM